MAARIRPHGHAQRIDRRIVDAHDQDGAGARKADGGAVVGILGRHAGSPVLVGSQCEIKVRKLILIANDTAFASRV
jgi:hypothetical protein